MLQRIDKELEEALATLEKEKDGALQDLDAQVRARSSFDAALSLLGYTSTFENFDPILMVQPMPPGQHCACVLAPLAPCCEGSVKSA